MKEFFRMVNRITSKEIYVPKILRNYVSTIETKAGTRLKSTQNQTKEMIDKMHIESIIDKWERIVRGNNKENPQVITMQTCIEDLKIMLRVNEQDH
ncbi:MAG: hypothetical protein ACJAVA_000323 [Flavobacteriaceae bacterium]|jgi:hypothetical protein